MFTVCHTNISLLVIMHKGELTRNTYKFTEVQLPTLLLSELNEMPKVRLKSKLKWKL